MRAVDTHSALGMKGNREVLANMIHFNQKTPVPLRVLKRSKLGRVLRTVGVTPRSEGKHKARWTGGSAPFRGTCDLGPKYSSCQDPESEHLVCGGTCDCPCPWALGQYGRKSYLAWVDP